MVLIRLGKSRVCFTLTSTVLSVLVGCGQFGCLFQNERQSHFVNPSPNIISQWINDDILYVSSYGDYSLRQYNVITKETDIIAHLNPDSSIAAFAWNPKNLKFYLVRQPLSRFARHHLATFSGKRILFQKKLEVSTLSTYDTKQQIWNDDTTFAEECTRVIIDPSGNNIILNATVQSIIDSAAASDYKRISYKVRMSVYSYNITSRAYTSVDVPSLALGFMSDSSLLLCRLGTRGGGFYRVSRTGQLEDVAEPAPNVWIPDIHSTLRLVPYTDIVTWYDKNSTKIHCFNVITKEATSVNALSDSYCMSPMGNKIAYLVWNRKTEEHDITICDISLGLE